MYIYTMYIYIVYIHNVLSTQCTCTCASSCCTPHVYDRIDSCYGCQHKMRGRWSFFFLFCIKLRRRHLSCLHNWALHGLRACRCVPWSTSNDLRLKLKERHKFSAVCRQKATNRQHHIFFQQCWMLAVARQWSLNTIVLINISYAIVQCTTCNTQRKASICSTWARNAGCQSYDKEYTSWTCR